MHVSLLSLLMVYCQNKVQKVATLWEFLSWLTRTSTKWILQFTGHKSSSYRLQFHSWIVQSLWKHKHLNVPQTTCSFFQPVQQSGFLKSWTISLSPEICKCMLCLFFIHFTLLYQLEHRTHCFKCHFKYLGFR